MSERSQRYLNKQTPIFINKETADRNITDTNQENAFIVDDVGNECISVEIVSQFDHDTTGLNITAERQGIASIAVQTTLSLKRSQLISTCFLSEKQLKHFSGFYRHEFQLICDFFKTNTHYTCALSMEDEILLTLMKYRHDFYYRSLEMMFDVDNRVVNRIINCWTNHMYCKMKSVNFWSLRRKRSEFEYDVIIDCTEIMIERSQDPVIQQTTFSAYKNTNTFKVLVGCTEYGAVVYVSDIYGGSTPDRVLVEKCGFLDVLEKGQFILADRGFDISDLLETKEVCLNIPPFKIKKQLSEQDVAKTRAIANRRILIEQINGLAKKNLILVHKMPTHIWPLANQIVYNCFMLTSFRNSIVKN